MRLNLFLVLLLCPHVVLAQVGVDLDTARILKPQHAEITSGLAVGSQEWALSAKGRLGMTEHLDAHLALSGVYVEDNLGFEFEMGSRHSLFGNRKNSALDGSVAGDLSITQTGPLMAIALDPKLLISKHFQYARKREIVLGVGAGAAIGFESRSEADDDAYFGFLGSALIGMDVNDLIHAVLDVGWRRDTLRVGAGAMIRF